MEKKIFHITIAFLLPFIYLGFWFFKNNQLPVNDAANYMMTATTMYQHFVDHGFWKGMIHLFIERGWRPIFFPDLAVPFLLIFKGNLFAAYGAVASLCLFVSITYVYLYFRLVLDRVSATVAASLIGLLPFIQSQLLMFYAESALFPCLIGAIYHLIKSDYLRQFKHVCGFVILMILALVVRPIEALTQIIFILTLFLFSGWYQNIFTGKQLAYLFASAFFALFLFFLSAFLPYLHLNVIPIMDEGGVLDKKMMKMIYYGMLGSALVTVIILLAVWSKQTKYLFTMLHSRINNAINQPLLIPAFATVFIGTLIWFLPFAFETAEWIYRTSLGDVAMNTGSLSGSHFSWDVLQIYLREEGLLAIIIITVMMIASLAILPVVTSKKIVLSAPFIYLILITPFPLWESFYTVQIITRKLSAAFPALMMAMLLIGLHAGRSWSLRVIIAMVLLMAQFILLFVLLFTPTNQNPSSILNHTIGYFIPAPSSIQPNPHDVVVQFFDEQAQKYKFRSISLEVIPGTPDARHPVEAEPINPFMLGVMLTASRKPYYANYAYVGRYLPDTLRKIVRDHDAIFLSDKITTMSISSYAANHYAKLFSEETNSSLKVFYELEMMYASNRLADIGLKPGPCLVVKTQKQGDYVGCLLISIINMNKDIRNV